MAQMARIGIKAACPDIPILIGGQVNFPSMNLGIKKSNNGFRILFGLYMETETQIRDIPKLSNNKPINAGFHFRPASVHIMDNDKQKKGSMGVI
jgi:hypothetical protein